MPSADGPDFATFFEVVTGREPFAWQADFAEQLVAGRIPDVIDVPTGLGKTSVIHCWAYALAVAEPSVQIPRRLCLVVDRRLVVDAAYRDAEHLKARLAGADAAAEASLRAIADGLRSLQSGVTTVPLAAMRMRGGITWESRWLTRPDQAAVIVGTIDQFGSRLLFRGYGVSPGMRPIDAALVGTDAWLVIDEAHIAEALVKTAGSVADHQRIVRSDSIVARTLHVTQMSATVDGSGAMFRADLEEQRSSTRFPQSAQAAARRLDAKKSARLVEVESLAAGSTKRRRELSQRLGRELADHARAIDPGASVVGVIANTIGTARATHDHLVRSGEHACLLIGRCREYERSAILTDYEHRLRVGADRSGAERLYVVATQTIEVGADFDLDAIVTECAPLSSLVQRFGRVNRVGARSPYESVIVYAEFFHGEANDPIYGAATHHTWEFLSSTAAHRHEPLDFSIPGVRELAARAPEESRADLPFIPTLLGSHIERWAATRPAPFPDQDVAPFLHGIDRGIPEVSVAWRVAPPVAGRNDEQQRQIWQQWLDLTRPVEWEFVSVPIWEARALLAGEATALATSDLETGGSIPEDALDVFQGIGAEGVAGVIYRGPGDGEGVELIRRPGDVNVGDRIVLDAAIGGHDEWGWTGRRAERDSTVPDVGDLAPTRTARSVRVDPQGRVLASLAADPLSASDVSEIVKCAVEVALEDVGADELPSIDREELVAGLHGLSSEGLLVTAARELLSQVLDGHWQPVLTEIGIDDQRGERVIILAQKPDEITPLDAISDDDEGSTSSSPRPKSLAVHSAEVRDLARRFTEALGVPDPVARAVALAAHLHDLGKADERFQVMLYDGDGLSAQAGEPRAKSGRDWRDPKARHAARIAGLPKGFRHEAVSGRIVATLLSEHPELTEGIDAELLRHLVVSHHGHARPLLPAIDDLDAPPVRLSVNDVEVPGSAPINVEIKGDRHQIDWSHPARFERLNERYGWWGLAFLETLVRLADMECSARIAPTGEASR